MARQELALEVLRLLRDSMDRAVRRRLMAAMVLVMMSGLLAALAPLALKGMVDAVASTGQGSDRRASVSIFLLGAGYVITLCGGRMLTELRPLLTGAAEQRLLALLTQRCFGHLLALPMQFHLGRKTGELVHNIHLATTGCQLLTAHLVNSLLPVLAEVATVTVVLLHLGQPALVATFTATAVAYVLLFAGGSRRLTERGHKVSDASLDVNATLADSLINCETVKCFVAEPALRSKLASCTDALELRWRELYLARARLGLAVTAAFTVSVATSLTLAAEAVAQGTLTIGGFVLANIYMLQIVRPLETLGSAARDLSQAVGFVGPLVQVLKEPSEVQAPARDAATAQSMTRDAFTSTPVAKRTASGMRSPSLRFEQICFAYDPVRPVLKAVDLDVPPGRTLAIVGASGSGKSSLVRLLLRLHVPQAGRILLGGHSIDTLPAAEVRTLIGLVSQDTVLFNDTLANNIGLGNPGAPRGDVEASARRAHLHDFITSLPEGYDTVVGERGLKLSGGERQRVAIARVLLKAPRIFVFDEATSMLDSRTEAGILHDLQAVSAGCTTITIAHRLSTVLHADEIAVLDKGEIKEQGTHAALLARGEIYARLWHTQMHGGGR